MLKKVLPFTFVYNVYRQGRDALCQRIDRFTNEQNLLLWECLLNTCMLFFSGSFVRSVIFLFRGCWLAVRIKLWKFEASITLTDWSRLMPRSDKTQIKRHRVKWKGIYRCRLVATWWTCFVLKIVRNRTALFADKPLPVEALWGDAGAKEPSVLTLLISSTA